MFANTEKANSDIFIPESFYMPVITHIIRNASIDRSSNFQPPLLLGIQGGAGMGKTFMVKEICQKYNINLNTISSSDLSGSVEAAPRDKLKDVYTNACVQVAKDNVFSAILIDDFHLSIATDSELGKTVNSNILSSALMNLCDNPWLNNTRIPIIATGNNYQRLYGALVRAGRMDLLTWTPSSGEIISIVTRIFKLRFESLEDSLIIKLTEMYPNHSIAFFSQVAEDILLVNMNSVVNEFMQSGGRLDVVTLKNKISNSISNIELTQDDIFEIAQRRANTVVADYENVSSNPNIVM